MIGQSLITSTWLAVASWFTPTALFLFVNLVIGTIAVTSRFTFQKKPQQLHHDQLAHPQLVRAPSLLDRVKSINFSLYKFPHQYPYPEEDQQQPPPVHFSQPVYGVNPVEPDPPQLTRAPSLLERMKSFNLSSIYSFQQPYPEEEEQQPPVQFSQPVYGVNPVEPDPPQLTRGLSFLERMKSLNLSFIYRSQQSNPQTETEILHDSQKDTKHSSDPTQGSESDPGHKPKRSKSETAKSKKNAQENMKKSVSERAMRVENEDEDEAERLERRRPQTARLERTVTIGEDDESVDAKADDFINRFKKQLKLQRLDSLLRYKEMLQGK